MDTAEFMENAKKDCKRIVDIIDDDSISIVYKKTEYIHQFYGLIDAICKSHHIIDAYKQTIIEMFGEEVLDDFIAKASEKYADIEKEFNKNETIDEKYEEGENSIPPEFLNKIIQFPDTDDISPQE